MTTPSAQAARNGLPGDLDATNASAQVNQLLGTHNVTPIYGGDQIVTPGGTTNFEFVYPGVYFDYSQPFTMPSGQTTVGRVTIPVLPVGSGADLVVTLCPDSGGAPQTDNPLASTVIPSAWINALTAPDGITAGGPLATAHTNTLAVDNPQTINYGTPVLGIGRLAPAVVSGNYMILLGGLNYDTTANTPNVTTIEYLGGTQIGNISAQPPLPEPLTGMAAAVTSDTVMVIAGGNDTASVTDVWAASWDPSTGTVGSWSRQPAYPTLIGSAGCASWGNTIYVVTGNAGGTATNAVYYATVSNGTFAAWQTGPPYPIAAEQLSVAAINGWLVGVGGLAGGTTMTNAVYYAKIHSDGSLGGWQQGPNIPTAVSNLNGTGWCYAATDSAIIMVEGALDPGPSTYANLIQILPVSKDGLGTWTQQTYIQSGTVQAAAFPAGNGQWQLFSFVDGQYISSTVHPMPVISVPLPAVGLVPGSTYHVVLQQSGGDSVGSSRGNDYLGIGLENAALPTAMLSRVRGTTTWSTFFAGWAVPMSVYGTGGTGRLEHTWEDGGAATSTLVHSAVTGALLGVCEQTAMPNNARNSNNLTTASIAPWTASGGTITASSAQTQGGYAYSGLLTPSGTQATSWAQSELMPVTQGQYYVASGWLYSPPGFGSVSLSVMWWDHAGNFISSSNASITLAAGAWTQVTNVFQAPTGAAQAALAPSEGGTPTAADTLYISAVTLTAALPGSLPSVAEVTYSGVWPPVGITQLA